MTAEKKKQQNKNTENEQAQEATTQEQSQQEQAHPPTLDVVPEESGDSTGAVRISEDVISAVVRKYALEVEGVVRFGSNTIVSGLAEMIGRKSSEGNVVVDLEDEAVNISVTLIVQFGVKIPEVSSLVQDVIRSRVEELTGKQVNRVDVTVQGLEEPEEEESETSESANNS